MIPATILKKRHKEPIAGVLPIEDLFLIRERSELARGDEIRTI